MRALLERLADADRPGPKVIQAAQDAFTRERVRADPTHLVLKYFWTADGDPAGTLVGFMGWAAEGFVMLVRSSRAGRWTRLGADLVTSRADATPIARRPGRHFAPIAATLRSSMPLSLPSGPIQLGIRWREGGREHMALSEWVVA